MYCHGVPIGVYSQTENTHVKPNESFARRAINYICTYYIFVEMQYGWVKITNSADCQRIIRLENKLQKAGWGTSAEIMNIVYSVHFL